MTYELNDIIKIGQESFEVVGFNFGNYILKNKDGGHKSVDVETINNRSLLSEYLKTHCIERFNVDDVIVDKSIFLNNKYKIYTIKSFNKDTKRYDVFSDEYGGSKYTFSKPYITINLVPLKYVKEHFPELLV